MPATTHVLLSATTDNYLDATGSLSGLKFPQGRVEFAVDGREVTWSVHVRGVVGAPASWSLSARFLDIIENTTGPQYAAPLELPFTQLQTATYVREKVGWAKNDAPNPPASAGVFGLIADNTDGLGAGVSSTLTRTVECFNLRHRLELQPVFVGGVNPALVLDIIAQVRS